MLATSHGLIKLEYQEIAKACMDKAHELLVADKQPIATEVETNAVVARIQGLLEVAKTATQLDAVKDAQILASRRALEDIRLNRAGRETA